MMMNITHFLFVGVNAPHDPTAMYTNLASAVVIVAMLFVIKYKSDPKTKAGN